MAAHGGSVSAQPLLPSAAGKSNHLNYNLEKRSNCGAVDGATTRLIPSPTALTANNFKPRYNTRTFVKDSHQQNRSSASKREASSKPSQLLQTSRSETRSSSGSSGSFETDTGSSTDTDTDTDTGTYTESSTDNSEYSSSMDEGEVSTVFEPVSTANDAGVTPRIVPDTTNSNTLDNKQDSTTVNAKHNSLKNNTLINMHPVKREGTLTKEKSQLSNAPAAEVPTVVSKEGTQVLDDNLVVEKVQAISSNEQNIIVVSDGVSSQQRHTPRTERKERKHSALESLGLEPPIVVTDDVSKDTTAAGDDTQGGDNPNLLQVSSNKPSSPPPQASTADVTEYRTTTQQDLSDNWDSKQRVTSDNDTDKTSVPGEAVLYKKPVKSAKRKPGYDPQAMIRNASRDPDSGDDVTAKAIFGSNWGTQKQAEQSPEDDRVLKLTEMLNQLNEQMNRMGDENKLLKEKNFELEKQQLRQKEAEEKATSEVQ